jgi:hypothetical protein
MLPLAKKGMACETGGHRGLHAIRHSFARNLYARGVEVKIISKLLGHACVEITYSRYINFFEGDIDDTLRQAVGAYARKREGGQLYRGGKVFRPLGYEEIIWARGSSAVVIPSY